MVHVMRDAKGTVQVEHEQHVLGLFNRSDWLEAMTEAGFQARCVPYDLSGVEPETLEVFAGIKPLS